MGKDSVWKKKITPDTIGGNLLLLFVSYLFLHLFFSRIENSFVFAFWLFSLIAFSVGLVGIVVIVGKKLWSVLKRVTAGKSTLKIKIALEEKEEA